MSPRHVDPLTQRRRQSAGVSKNLSQGTADYITSLEIAIGELEAELHKTKAGFVKSDTANSIVVNPQPTGQYAPKQTATSNLWLPNGAALSFYTELPEMKQDKRTGRQYETEGRTISVRLARHGQPRLEIQSNGYADLLIRPGASNHFAVFHGSA